MGMGKMTGGGTSSQATRNGFPESQTYLQPSSLVPTAGGSKPWPQGPDGDQMWPTVSLHEAHEI